MSPLFVQNSWGPGWGHAGFGHISYDDWLANGSDVWVARLGAPVSFGTAEATARGNAYIAGLGNGYTYAQLSPHIISLQNDGELSEQGTYAKSANDVKSLFTTDLPRITQGWAKKRIMLYAHGGLVGEAGAVQHVADTRASLLEAEVYPLAFVWHSDFWTTLKNILADAMRRRRPEGFLDTAKNFMLDRLDDALEPVARLVGGKAAWEEMKENADFATTTKNGGARLVANCLADLMAADPSVEIHVVGHSAGSIFHAPLVQYLAGRLQAGRKIATCTLWAPACTVDLFKKAYIPVVNSGRLSKFAMFTLTDRAEQDDHCANIYNKSLLYLVSNAFEKEARIPFFRDGWPMLGMEKFVNADRDLLTFFKKPNVEWVRSPNAEAEGSPYASRSTSHGGFDDDRATLKATLARILGGGKHTATRSTAMIMQPSAQQLSVRRSRLDLATRS